MNRVQLIRFKSETNEYGNSNVFQLTDDQFENILDQLEGFNRNNKKTNEVIN